MNLIENYYSFFFALFSVMGLSFLLINSVIEKVRFSILIVVAKFSIFAIYFLFFSEAFPVILADDQEYYHLSLELFHEANGNILFFFDAANIATVASVAGGSHFGYFIYNFLSFTLFGPYYYSPILINIVMSIISGIMMYKITVLLSFSRGFSLFFFVFYLLHWDIQAWTSFVNLKDIFVLTQSTTILYTTFLILNKGFTWRRVMLLLLLLFILTFFRFYLAYFLAATFTIAYCVKVVQNRFKHRWTNLLIKFSIGVVMPILFYISFITLFREMLLNVGGTTNPVIGIVRFLLTPVPWQVEDRYTFILIPSILHWVSIILVILGFRMFFSRNLFFEMLPMIILFLFLTVFYGSFGMLQGPRQRIGIVYFLSFLQALSVFEILKMSIYKSRFRELSENLKLD